MNWSPIEINLSALVPWEYNPKTISKSHAKRLLKLWDELGQFQTIAVGPQGQVYDGHQRLSVLLAAHGAAYTVKALQSERPLTEEERAELVIAAHVGTVGQFDWQKLSGWDTATLTQWGMDAETLQGWNSDAANLATMLGVDVESEQVVGMDVIDEQYAIMIECESETVQADLLERFNTEGLKCRALIS